MSSKPDAYLFPIDPTSPATKESVGIDASKLWSSSRVDSKKPGESRLFYVDQGDSQSNIVSLVSLGADAAKKSEDVRKERLRSATGLGARALKEAGAKVIAIDTAGDAHVAAEGAHLASFKFSLKTKKDSSEDSEVKFEPLGEASSTKGLNWETGVLYANSQNLARELTELPANMCTPTIFCERVSKEFKGLENVEIIIRDEAWAAEKEMRTFLSVTKGTSEPAKLLEIHYRGAPSKEAQPLAFVGKGITFDSGGISIKPAADMKLMRGDMGGAAAVVSAALGIAKLRLPINLVVVTPLCENLPGPSANKPGDVIYAMNGKTIEIDNTDAEGRLILADALTYVSRTFKPHTLVDVATLTGAMVISVGDAYSGVFSTSDTLWNELHTAGETEFDRFWRMPLDDAFGPQIYSSNADLCNTGGKPGGSCTAALFLKAFVEGIDAEEGQEPALRWAHVDIAGSMEALRTRAYEYKGMSGRPTRALIEFARRSAK